MRGGGEDLFWVRGVSILQQPHIVLVAICIIDMHKKQNLKFQPA